jgi:hypothetical protein
MQQQNKNMNVVGGNTLSMRILRVWMWLVPFTMILAAVLFGVVAVSDGKWGLFVVMFFMGALGAGLLVVHYWLLYRFGKDAGNQQ